MSALSISWSLLPRPAGVTDDTFVSLTWPAEDGALVTSRLRVSSDIDGYHFELTGGPSVDEWALDELAHDLKLHDSNGWAKPQYQVDAAALDGDRISDLLVLFDAALNLAEKHAALRARAGVHGNGGEVLVVDDVAAAEYAARLWASARSFFVDDRVHDYPEQTIRALRVYSPCQMDALIRVQWPSVPKLAAASDFGWSPAQHTAGGSL